MFEKAKRGEVRRRICDEERRTNVKENEKENKKLIKTEILLKQN